MRLEISRRADLALHALTILARLRRRVKATELAALLGTTAGFVPQVMAPLVARGWIDSDPGPTGGYASARPLDGLSVLEVIEAVEGPTDTHRCVLENRPCNGDGHCAVHFPWKAARTQLLDHLARLPVTRIPTARRTT